MNLVNEEHVALFEAGEKSCEFAGFLDHRAARVLDVHAHRISDDVGQGRLAEPGRSTQENVLEYVAALFSRFHHELQPFAHFYLTRELVERGRSQRNFKSSVRLRRFHSDNRESLHRESLHRQIESPFTIHELRFTIHDSSFFVSTNSVPRRLWT